MYTQRTMQKVRDALAAELPGVVFAETDYGFGLSAADPRRERAVVLFAVHYGTDADGDSIVTGITRTKLADVPRVAAILRGTDG